MASQSGQPAWACLATSASTLPAASAQRITVLGVGILQKAILDQGVALALVDFDGRNDDTTALTGSVAAGPLGAG